MLILAFHGGTLIHTDSLALILLLLAGLAGLVILHLRANVKRLEEDVQALTLRAARADSEVRDHILRFRNMAESLPDLMWVTQADGQTIFRNKACERYLGVSRAPESVRSSCRRLIHPDDYDRVIEHALDAFTKNEFGQWQFRILCPEEGYRWFEGSCTPLFNEQGILTHWFLRSTDIHEKTLALDQAFTSDQKLQSIVNSLPIFIWTMNNHGICDFLEGRLLADLGLKSNQLVGRTYEEFFGEKDVAIENYKRALAGEEFSSFRDMGDRLLEMHYSTLYESNGKRSGVVGIGVDITAIRKADLEREEFRIREKAAREASRLKSDFLANMSHEIRTPLNGVIGMGRLLRETELTPEQLPMVESIEICSRSLLQVVTDVLDISKIEAGKMLLENTTFDLPACLAHVHAITSIMTQEKGLELQFQLAGDLPRQVIGDVHRLHQILLNLLSNAVKFTQSGGISLDCYATQRDPHTYTLRVVVSDTGIGMSSEQIQHIFQYFTQADATTTRRFGGTGLGLSIAKNLCEAMNGSIAVQSVEGEGSQITFTVELGVAAMHEGDGAIIPSSTATLGNVPMTQGHVPAPLSIVVAEDNGINGFLMQNYLRKLNYDCDVVRDGDELLQRVSEGHFDVIFMDVHMPKVDGIVATRRIRAIGNGIKQPHIIAVTASALLEDKEICLAVGMNDFLSKPVRMECLIECLSRIKPKSNRQSVTEFAPSPDDVFADFDGDTAIFDELSRLFQEQRLDLESRIEQAIETEDFETLIRLSHTLRGTLCNFTSVLATPSAEALERAAKEQDLDEAKSYFAILRPELDQLAAHMEQRRQFQL